MSNDITIVSAKPDREDEKSLELQLNEEALRKEAIDGRDLIKSLQYELDQREDDFKDGLSFLDIKNDTLLSYMIDVCNIVLRKVRGESIDDHPSVERCVTYRVILEKIKAIDQRLAYQLNRLITLPEDANSVEEDRVDVNNLDIDLDDAGDSDVEDDQPARSRDHLSRRNLDDDDEEDDSDGVDSMSEISDDDDEEEEEDDDEEVDSASSGDHEVVQRKRDRGASSEKQRSLQLKSTNQKSNKSVGVYKPPKLRSVAYTEEGDRAMGGRRKNYDEFYQDDDATGDIVEGSSHIDRKSREERVRFEEDHYTRLPDENPKKAKRKLRTKEYRRKGKRMRR